MRVSRKQAEANRENVINAASRLFRGNGFDGIGLKDIMKNAGLTQGAFYKQFSSKEDLQIQASARGFECAVRRWSAAASEVPEDPLGAVLSLYLSIGHRDEQPDGCPIVALGSDAARQSRDVKAEFETGIKEHFEILDRLGGRAPGEATSAASMAMLSTMVGALILSRAVNDETLSEEILQAAADHALCVAEKTPRKGTIQ